MRSAPRRCTVMAGALLAGVLLAGVSGAAPMTGGTGSATPAALPPSPPRQPSASQRSAGAAPSRPGTPLASVNAVRLRSLLATTASQHVLRRATVARAAGGKPGVGQVVVARHAGVRAGIVARTTHAAVVDGSRMRRHPG